MTDLLEKLLKSTTAHEVLTATTNLFEISAIIMCDSIDKFSCVCLFEWDVVQGRQERRFQWDGLCPVHIVGLVGQDNYVPDWILKDGLLRPV